MKNWSVARMIVLVIISVSTFLQGIAQSAKQTIASVSPQYFTVDYLTAPQGLDNVQPHFGWKLRANDSLQFGQFQTAYQVQVGLSLGVGKTFQPTLWDSQWQQTANSQHIVYKGKPLQADRTYAWRVRVRDEKGRVSAWSPLQTWSTGILQTQEWKASWIGSHEQYDTQAPDNNVNDPWFRKDFDLKQQPSQAYMHVASVGYHELYINGQKIGEDVLAPAVSDHTKRARYVTYNIAPFLKKGKNTVGLWLGASWAIYPPYILDPNRPLTPIVSAQVAIYHQSPLIETQTPDLFLITDGSWKTHASPNRLIGKWDFRNMGGEMWDARKEITNWNATDFDASNWVFAKVYTPKLAVSAQRVEKNYLSKEIRPTQIEKRKDGSYRVDMGVNFAGWTEVTVKGNPGDTIRFEYSEHETTDMTFNLRSAYIIGSKGNGTFRNRFNYSSGRWITIRGLKQAPQLTDIKGWMIRTGFQDAAEFASSAPLQNWIYNTTRWTLENLALGGYIVDCPQRERMGYGGDAHATSETGMFNYNLAAFYRKWMEDWRDVQGTEPMVGNMLDPTYARKAVTSGRILNNGTLPHTAPTYWGGGGPSWGGIVVTLPWFMYQHYGDERVLHENFTLAQNWLNFLKSNTKDNVLQRFGGQWDFLGDWLWPNATAEGMNNDKPETLFLNNAYYVFNLRTAAKIALTIGKKAEAKAWDEQAELTAKAIHARFYKEDTHTYVDGSMANLAAALLADVPPRTLREKVWKSLETEILFNRKGHIHAGITGGALLFKLLREENRNDLLYTMLSKTSYPSWGFMKENGATTMWEAWEKDLPGHSLLHSSYLYPGAWYIEGLAGIKRHSNGPAFRRFTIQPPVKTATDVTWVKATYDSPQGKITSNWSRKNGKLQLHITVPPNTLAELRVEGSEELSIQYYNTIKMLPDHGTLKVYELQPGSYTLESK